MAMGFLDLSSILSTRAPDIRVHRAGSQLKMSKSQTSAGNLSSFKCVKCQMSNAYVDPWDMPSNFCFHV